MLYGTVLRAPVEGSVPDKIDDAKAKPSPASCGIVPLPYGVGVLAETPWAAFDARRALTQSVTWSSTGTAWGFDSDQGIDRFAADAKNPARMATEWSKIGDPRRDAEVRPLPSDAEYRCDYAYHAQMEPLNAIAAVSPAGDAVEIWTGTQSQTTATEAPAKLSASRRQGEAARHADGRRLRPARQSRRRFHHRCRADVEGGRPAGEGDVDARRRHRKRPAPSDLRPCAEGGFRPIRQAHRLAAPYRRRPRWRLLWIRCAIKWPAARISSPCWARTSRATIATSTRGAALSRYRGTHQSPSWISFLANKFATVSFIDEIRPAWLDPLAYHLELLKGSPRAIKVVERVAEMAEWGKKRDRPRTRLRPLDYSGSDVAGIAEIRQPRERPRSRCITSGARSIAAWRCSPTM